ncbi:MAG: sensor histidine kinase [Candidatus Thorarchaeota archaeon]|jgi:signal transduction histidine kinase
MAEQNQEQTTSLLRVGIRIIGGVSVIVFFLSFDIPIWQSYQISAAFHTLLAFSAITGAAVTLLSHYKNPSAFHLLFSSALLLFASSSIIGAIGHLLDTSRTQIYGSPVDITTGLFVLALFSGSLVTAQLSPKFINRASTGQQWLWVIATISAAIASLLIIQAFVFPLLPAFVIQILASTFGIFSFCILLSSAWIMYRRKTRLHEYDTARFMTSIILLALSVIPLLVSVYIGTALWRISVLLQVSAFLVFFITSALSHRSDVISTQTAYVFAAVISMLPFLPLLVTIILQIAMPSVTFVNLGTYLIIHLTSAILTATLGGLVYNYSKVKPAWNQYPTVLVFGSWSLTELFQLLLTVGHTTPTIDSRTMLTLGSIVTVVLLMVAFVWTIKPPSDEPVLALKKIIYALVGISVTLSFGWSVIFWFTQQSIAFGSGGGLVTLSLIAIFFVTFLFLLQLSDSEGQMNVEVISIGYLAAWIAPNVLRGFFVDYTPGWWIGEVMFLIGLLSGPGVLAIQYLSSFRDAEVAKRQAVASHQDATLYADVLGHDISNLHQAIATAIGILNIGEIDGEIRERAISSAQSSLERANQLVNSVRQLGMIRQMGPDAFKKMDLVHCILLAYEDVCGESGANLHLNITSEECYVMATPLLDVMFVNIFRNTMQQDVEKRVRVEIHETVQDCGDYWQVHFIDEGHSIPPEQKDTLFNSIEGTERGTGLGLAVVRALAESFGGNVEVQDLVPDDYTKGTVYTIILPACK